MRQVVFSGIAAAIICVSCLALPVTGKIAAKTVSIPPKAVGCGAGGLPMINQSTPLNPGPLQLEAIFCVNLPPSSYGFSPLLISPDGAHYFVYNVIEGLSIGAVKSRAKPQHVEGRLAVPGLGYAETQPFGWSANSQIIFGARQVTTKPSGFALSPLTPIIIPVGKSPRPLPVLKQATGGLDGLLWVGGQGLALAEFGTKGSYYRPEHADPHPTIAIVDGRKGKVIQAAAMPVVNSGKPEALIATIDARLDGRSKIYTVMVIGEQNWFEWRQGEILHALPVKIDKSGSTLFAISPNLKTVLVMHNLSATGVICELYGSRKSTCPQPTPMTGIIADLREIKTGRVIWRITGTATYFSSSYKPAISPNGRYALVTMPRSVEVSETTALISMKDGRVLQRIAHPWNSECTTGFGSDGKSAWISGGSSIVVYRLNG